MSNYRGQRRFGDTPITRGQFANVVKVGYGFSVGHWLFRLTLRGAREIWGLFVIIVIAANGGAIYLEKQLVFNDPWYWQNHEDQGMTILLTVAVITTLVSGYLTYRVFRWVGIKAYQWAERNLL